MQAVLPLCNLKPHRADSIINGEKYNYSMTLKKLLSNINLLMVVFKCKGLWKKRNNHIYLVHFMRTKIFYFFAEKLLRIVWAVLAVCSLYCLHHGAINQLF